MDYFCECEFPVGSRNVDRNNRCRPSALLAFMQEAGTIAAADIGVSREEMLARYNTFWMLARVWFRLERPVGAQEVVQLRTWHRGGKGVTIYRDFDISVKGEPVGEAVSAWVLADQDTRKMMRFGDIVQFRQTTGGSLCKDIRLAKLQLPAALTEVGRRRLYDSDTDVNGHVNNARYGDLATDALGLEALDDSYFIQQMQVGYLSESMPGDELLLLTAQEGGKYFARGAGADGAAHFDASLTLGRKL